MRAHGMIPMLEVLDEFTTKSPADLVVRILRLMNAVS